MFLLFLLSLLSLSTLRVFRVFSENFLGMIEQVSFIKSMQKVITKKSMTIQQSKAKQSKAKQSKAKQSKQILFVAGWVNGSYIQLMWVCGNGFVEGGSGAAAPPFIKCWIILG